MGRDVQRDTKFTLKMKRQKKKKIRLIKEFIFKSKRKKMEDRRKRGEDKRKYVVVRDSSTQSAVSVRYKSPTSTSWTRREMVKETN